MSVHTRAFGHFDVGVQVPDIFEIQETLLACCNLSVNTHRPNRRRGRERSALPDRIQFASTPRAIDGASHQVTFSLDSLPSLQNPSAQ